MKVELYVHTGFAAATHREVVEVPDDITDDELDEWAKAYCFERVEYGWKKLNGWKKLIGEDD